ncbi:MAG: SGNH/GDSL hydrolase family protein [Oscillospiraceae bacterium]
MSKLILFQGDSVTDCDRSREDLNDLGLGYPKFVAGFFNARYPGEDVNFLNRGISGNRVRDLKARWANDCIALKPDIVSILIGINDTWRRYDEANDPTTAAEYESDYRYILNEIKTKLPNTEIVMMEPFVLQSPPDRLIWREDLDPKIHVVRKLAAEFGATFIALDGIFAEASIASYPAKWSADGVHPSPNGHALIAENWLNAMNF